MMDSWKPGDQDRRSDSDLRADIRILNRDLQSELSRRSKWEGDQDELMTSIVAEIELQKKFRWQSLALLTFLSLAIPIGLTILGFMIK